MTTKIGIYIGRFQPFHNGHAHVLSAALAENDLVIILVGSAFQARTIKNPFSYEERVDTILRWAANDQTRQKLWFKSIRDYPYNNARWIESVQKAVAECVESTEGAHGNRASGSVELTLYGSNRDRSTWYLSSFPQWKFRAVDKFPVSGNLTATFLRDNIFTGNLDKIKSDLPVTTARWLTEWLASDSNAHLFAEYEYIANYKKSWAGAPFPPTFVTADAVVIQSGHVLVVERANMPGRGLWALPGGFVKQFQRVQDAAIDELMEETGIRLADGKRAEEITRDILRNSIKGKEIFDDPERSLRGRTITTAFFFRLDDTKPMPKVSGQNVPEYESNGQQIVETAWAKWIPINEARANTEKWFEDHNAIFETMLGMNKDDI